MLLKGRLGTLVAVLLLALLVVGSRPTESGAWSNLTPIAYETSGQPVATDVATSSSSSLAGTLKGSGSTFANAYYQKLIVSFADVAPNVDIAYDAIGSGKGKSEFGKNLTDFAGTDSLVKDTDGPKPGTFYYVPTTAAPITVSYHLNGVKALRLSPQTLAKIFQRDVKRWDDPAIKADNPNTTMPAKAIGVVHRLDGSGTTSNFTNYLAAAAGDVWRLGSGDTVAWPSDTSAGQANTGVARLLKDNNGSVGYVDLSDAKSFGLSFASIRNKAGRFVAPGIEGASAALAQAQVADNLSYNPLDAGGVGSYPITAPTFILVRASYPDKSTTANVKGFLTYLLTNGQDMAASVNFAKLPEDLRQRSLAQLDKITVG